MDFTDGHLYNELYTLTRQKLSAGEHPEEIETHLRMRTEDVVLVTVIIKEARKAHNNELQRDGFRKLLIGVALVAGGFLITLFNFGSERSSDYALFGLTSLGIGFVLFGLYRIIG